MNINRHRRAIEKFYTDRCTISRYQDYKDPVTKQTKLQPVTIYDDKPCRISQRALGANSQTEAQNEIAYETKMFIAPEIEVRQGDAIEVTRSGVSRTYEAGEPFLYPSHQAISLQRKGYA